MKVFVFLEPGSTRCAAVSSAIAWCEEIRVIIEDSWKSDAFRIISHSVHISLRETPKFQLHGPFGFCVPIWRAEVLT